MWGGRCCAGWIEKRIAAYPRFQAIDRAVGKEGFKIVLLLRLSPVFPFNLLNYALGLTNVRLWQYVLASWVGMLPGTLMYVYLGSALKSLADVAAGAPKGGTPQTVFFVAGLVMTVVATVVVTRVARRALNEAVAAARSSRTDRVAREIGPHLRARLLSESFDMSLLLEKPMSRELLGKVLPDDPYNRTLVRKRPPRRLDQSRTGPAIQPGR